jgi:hypothetical protein
MSWPVNRMGVTAGVMTHRQTQPGTSGKHLPRTFPGGTESVGAHMSEEQGLTPERARLKEKQIDELARTRSAAETVMHHLRADLPILSPLSEQAEVEAYANALLCAVESIKALGYGRKLAALPADGNDKKAVAVEIYRLAMSRDNLQLIVQRLRLWNQIGIASTSIGIDHWLRRGLLQEVFADTPETKQGAPAPAVKDPKGSETPQADLTEMPADDPPLAWTTPDSPQRWAKVFGFSVDTLKRRFKAGQIRHKKLSTKSYQIAVDDLPAAQQTKFRAAQNPPAK